MPTKGDQAAVTHRANDTEDPVLAMLGVGKHLWKSEPGVPFIERLRSEDLPAPPCSSGPANPDGDLAETVWRSVRAVDNSDCH
jgi:hypothetical protein